MPMEKKVERFYQFMEEYTDFMSEMAAQEDKKYSALISNDLSRMDKAIAEQQAMLMKLEKVELERAALQKEIGWDGLTFHEIVEQLEGDSEKRAFGNLFDRVSRLLEQIRYGNDKSVSFARMSLQINGLLDESGKLEEEQQYTANKEKTTNKDKDSSGSVFETKV